MKGLHHINLGNIIQCIIYNYQYYATSCFPAPFLRLLLGWLLGLVFMNQNLTFQRPQANVQPCSCFSLPNTEFTNTPHPTSFLWLLSITESSSPNWLSPLETSVWK